MRRARRILLITATLVSTAICIATIILWIRSYASGDSMRWPGPGASFYYANSTRGELYAGRMLYIYPPTIPDTFLTRHGFIWFNDVILVAAVPHWFVVFLSLPLPLATIIVRRRRRRAEDLCSNCGYDLRASPDRCPECGAASPAIPPAPSTL